MVLIAAGEINPEQEPATYQEALGELMLADMEGCAADYLTVDWETNGVTFAYHKGNEQYILEYRRYSQNGSDEHVVSYLIKKIKFLDGKKTDVYVNLANQAAAKNPTEWWMDEHLEAYAVKLMG